MSLKRNLSRKLPACSGDINNAAASSTRRTLMKPARSCLMLNQVWRDHSAAEDMLCFHHGADGSTALGAGAEFCLVAAGDGARAVAASSGMSKGADSISRPSSSMRLDRRLMSIVETARK